MTNIKTQPHDMKIQTGIAYFGIFAIVGGFTYRSLVVAGEAFDFSCGWVVAAVFYGVLFLLSGTSWILTAFYRTPGDPYE